MKDCILFTAIPTYCLDAARGYDSSSTSPPVCSIHFMAVQCCLSPFANRLISAVHLLSRYATHLFNDAEDIEEDDSPRNFRRKEQFATGTSKLARKPSRLTALKDDHHEEEYW